jgi:plastocyanin
MKQVYALVFGFGGFFALNCGSGTESGYPEPAPNGAEPPTEAAPAARAASTANVTVNGHTFDPPEVRIKAGGTVTWTWASGSHNVISGSGCTPDGKFSNVKLQGRGATYEETFETPGTYPYFCDPHCSIGMKGTIVVE